VKCYSGDSVCLRNPYSIEHKKHQHSARTNRLSDCSSAYPWSLGIPNIDTQQGASNIASGRGVVAWIGVPNESKKEGGGGRDDILLAMRGKKGEQ
jgi:hypothetical protein